MKVNILHNFFGHLATVTIHRHRVLVHCIKAGIVWRGLVHDLSKFSPTEFIPGVKYYQGTRSPNEMERENVGYSRAWMHHKGRNRHHFEFWTDYNPKTRRLEPVPMPDIFVYEMFCDRVAASKTYNKEKYNDSSSLEYFLRGKSNRLMIAQSTSDQIEFLLTMLSEKGEDYTFAYIHSKVRELRKNQKNEH
ncbi:MAG: DUF5662 family protein [Oscillospiraceae bacterium]|nr:DUF5662 family protein [Oscillospiraceae bacterium]